MKLIDEIQKIVEKYNNINNTNINEDEFNSYSISSFIQSWDVIKKNSVQYKCRVLRDLDKGQKPYDMKLDNLLCDFLVDDGDKEGGMFLAAAYQFLIEAQNTFINNIISKNDINGVLNSYIGQLEQEINVQDATQNEIINIDDEVFELFEKLVIANSMRNIFSNDNKKKDDINYSNYKDIIYNYDIIEEELGKKILPGVKKFTYDKIKFVTYLYEGFRGENSSILKDYVAKYEQRELKEREKDSLYNLLEENRNSRFYNDVFASLQILMNQIIKENYEKNQLIVEIIQKLPKYIFLEPKLIKFFQKQSEYYYELHLFPVDSLISIFDYFEALCWKDMKKNIPIDYQKEIPENVKNDIISYFDKNENKKKIINRENFTSAIRKFISRHIAVTRQEMEVKDAGNLKHYIIDDDLWNKNDVTTDGFENEIDDIFKHEILISQSYELYNALRGDAILEHKLFKKKKRDEDIGEMLYNNDNKSNNENELAKALEENQDNNEIINTATKGNTNDDNNSENSENSEEDEDEDDFRADEI